MNITCIFVLSSYEVTVSEVLLSSFNCSTLGFHLHDAHAKLFSRPSCALHLRIVVRDDSMLDKSRTQNGSTIGSLKDLLRHVSRREDANLGRPVSGSKTQRNLVILTMILKQFVIIYKIDQFVIEIFKCS